MTISFMCTEYNRRIKDDVHDVLGIFIDGKLSGTKMTKNGSEFIKWANSKKPKTIIGAKRIISKFNKELSPEK